MSTANVRSFAKEVSFELGLDGKINDKVLVEARRRLDDLGRVAGKDWLGYDEAIEEIIEISEELSDERFGKLIREIVADPSDLVSDSLNDLEVENIVELCEKMIPRMKDVEYCDDNRECGFFFRKVEEKSSCTTDEEKGSFPDPEIRYPKYGGTFTDDFCDRTRSRYRITNVDCVFPHLIEHRAVQNVINLCGFSDKDVISKLSYRSSWKQNPHNGMVGDLCMTFEDTISRGTGRMGLLIVDDMYIFVSMKGIEPV